MALNPKFDTVTVGIEEEYNVTLLPLSIGHQREVAKRMKSSITQLLQGEESRDYDSIVNTVMSFLENDLEFILDAAIKEEVSVFDITNEQFQEIVTKIYERNYSNILKNLKSLFTKTVEGQENT